MFIRELSLEMVSQRKMRSEKYWNGNLSSCKVVNP